MTRRRAALIGLESVSTRMELREEEIIEGLDNTRSPLQSPSGPSLENERTEATPKDQTKRKRASSSETDIEEVPNCIKKAGTDAQKKLRDADLSSVLLCAHRPNCHAEYRILYSENQTTFKMKLFPGPYVARQYLFMIRVIEDLGESAADSSTKVISLKINSIPLKRFLGHYQHVFLSKLDGWRRKCLCCFTIIRTKRRYY